MQIIGELVLVAIGIVIGFAYFHYRKRPSDHLMDQDYIDCAGTTTSKADLASCYIGKKTKKIKKELDIAD